MAVKSQVSSRAGNGVGAPPVRDELFVNNDTVSLCFLLNRRAGAVRIIDFRAGPNPRKREAVLKLARQERMHKVYTLVERDEVPTWTKLGFAKEGNIPGFYKRSDAFLLGCPASAPFASETRLAVARPSPIEASFSSEARRIADEEEIMALVDEEDKTVSPAMLKAEKTLAKAKRAAKLDKVFPRTTIAPARESEAKKAAERAQKKGVALTAFEPFGRDTERRYFTVTSRGGFELWASVESQACFGNAFLELLTAPTSDAEIPAATASLRALVDMLVKEGAVSVFSLVPSDNVALASAYVTNGFRRTGVLENHMVVGGARKDAILFSRKLTVTPAD